MNEYDSSRMAAMLSASGLTPVEDIEEADLVILNTCAVREKAEEKIFHLLGRLRPLKEARPERLIAVGGCVAAERGEQIRSRARFVDIIFGPQTYHRLPEMIRRVENGEGPQTDVSFPPNEKFAFLPPRKSGGPSAFVTIMEGCSHFCSYCIVPYTRGGEISRSSEEILQEIRQLRDSGTREINLLGQNVNCYRGVNPDGSICTFAELLHRVAAVEGIERIRFTTSNPIEFTQDIIDAIGEISKIANAVHLPAQSGSNRILALMNRSYTADEYRDMVRRLRLVRPGISISSDFIVGFPGETDSDFEDTMRLIEDIRFDGCFSFVYSKRPGTPAADLEDPVPPEVKSQRLARLQQMVNALALQHSREMADTVQRVLVEGPSKDGQFLCGRTSNNRIVNFTGPAELAGSMADVRITGILPHSLRGELLTIS